MKRKFLVELEMPKDVGIWEMAGYIDAAVRTHCGSLHPAEPVFHLDRKSVVVGHATELRLQKALEDLDVKTKTA